MRANDDSWINKCSMLMEKEIIEALSVKVCFRLALSFCAKMSE